MPTENSTESNNPAAPGQPGSGEVNTDSNSGGNAVSTGAAGQGASVPSPPPHSAPAGHSPSSGAGPNFGEVITAIQSMPEQIVRALREATQPAQQPRTASPGASPQDGGSGSQTAAQGGSRGNSAEGAKSPGSKSFAAWWFGR